MSESGQPGGATSQIPTQMTTTVGQLDNFDPNKEHWECHFERFEQFTVINNIAPERQVACLLAVMGPSTLEITIFMDIAENPGPMFKLSTHRSCKDRCAPDLHILHNQTITYSRSLLFAIRRLGRGVASCATLAKNVFFPEVSRFSWR